MKTFTQQSNIQ